MDTGIVIANTGSPSAPTPDAVESYLSSYLMDPHIRQLPKIAWNFLLRKAILPKRRFSSSERYRFVWEEGERTRSACAPRSSGCATARGCSPRPPAASRSARP